MPALSLAREPEQSILKGVSVRFLTLKGHRFGLLLSVGILSH